MINAEVRVLARDIGFTEGPVWTSDERLLVTSVSRGLVYGVSLDGGEAAPVLEPGGGPNGMAEDADGVLWIAQNGGTIVRSRSSRVVTPSIQRARDAEVEDVLTDGLDAPNDCVAAPDGRLWFTDPRGPAHAGEPESGRLWALDPRTGGAEVLQHGLRYPNGLAFGPDPADFYLAETATRRILRFRISGGGLSAPEVFATLPAGEPDGLAFDCDGRLHVAATTADAVMVLDPGGRCVEMLDLGGRCFPTNLCFGGPGLATLLVTAGKGGRVLAVERRTPGLSLPVAA